MPKKKISAVKIGVLAIVGLSLLIFILIWLRGRGLAQGTPYVVRFTDIDGMREGAAVQMMGIRVGFIDKIMLEQVNGNKNYVKVTFNINNPDIRIVPGSDLSIEQSGLIGEKYLEIIPPQLREVIIPTFSNISPYIYRGMDVKFLYEEGLMRVGRVERVEKLYDGNLVRQKLYYRITLPGAEMPENPVFELVQEESKQEQQKGVLHGFQKGPSEPRYYLRIVSQNPVLTPAPDKNLFFTIENPLRMKRFLEVQLESAEALKETNYRINQLLSDETIASLKSTLKNTEVLTARATDVLDTANNLFQSAHADLTDLVKTTDDLSHNLIQVSSNINSVIGDPKFKQQLLATTASLEESSSSLRDLLNDPELKETIAMAKNASSNASELTGLLRRTAEDKTLQERLNQSLTLLNDSLSKLSVVLGNVDTLSSKDKNGVVSGILEDSRKASENLRQFSEKLNKRFLLFRLMF